MQLLPIIDILSRIVHVSTAIVLVGGSVFMLLVLMPAAKTLSEEIHEQLRSQLNGRWKRFVHAGIALFLLSGFYNFFRAIPLHKGDALYHGIVGTKILLALVVFFIASALVGRSAKLEPMRQKRAFWLKFMLLLAFAIVSVSGYLKVRGVPSVSTNEPTVSQQ